MYRIIEKKSTRSGMNILYILHYINNIIFRSFFLCHNLMYVYLLLGNMGFKNACFNITSLC